MRIRKKDDREEIFEVEKLQRSIKNSAKDMNFSLNSSDVNLISDEVLKILIKLHGSDGLTNSYEVIAVTINVLQKLKFDLIIPSYLNLI
ncbi:hypothetical protein [Clostridium paraputrificum]|uniref:hypothetical protein n=1 Tax=Clostridium paraputrificum TaxID=29363 RepID=UPI00189C18CA|nr:hypothetical protein [Clostridium paraputrificum]